MSKNILSITFWKIKLVGFGIITLNSIYLRKLKGSRHPILISCSCCCWANSFSQSLQRGSFSVLVARIVNIWITNQLDRVIFCQKFALQEERMMNLRDFSPFKHLAWKNEYETLLTTNNDNNLKPFSLSFWVLDFRIVKLFVLF